MTLSNKICKIIIISLCGVLGTLLIFLIFIKQEAPLFNGKWSNEDGSFLMDTDTFIATITTDNVSESFIVAYTPGVHFAMYYPVSEGTAGVDAKDFIHTGDIYRVKFWGLDYIRVKCDDGCFDVWLKKTE